MRYALAALPNKEGGQQTHVASNNWLRHSVYGHLGLWPAVAQHTAEGHETIREAAQGAGHLRAKRN